MRYYLSPFIGTGTFKDSFRAYGLDQPGFRMIDLRPDATRATGRALCVAPTLPSESGVTDLGDAMDTPSNSMKRAIENRLSLTLEATTLREIIKELLIIHARTDGTRWKPLKANRRGRLEAYLGEQLFSMPVIAGGAIHTEDWNCANNASLTCDLTWVEDHADSGISWDLSSNKAVLTWNGSGPAAAEDRANHALDSDDHYVQAAIASCTSVSGYAVAGVIARKHASSTRTYYIFRYVAGSGYNKYELLKMVSGTETSLASDTTTVFSANQVARLEVDGSTINTKVDGNASITNFTDTAITGNLYCGIAGYFDTNTSNTSHIDNWEAGDVTAAGQPTMRRWGGVRGMQLTGRRSW